MKKKYSLPIIVMILISMLLSLNILSVYGWSYSTITIPTESTSSPASVFPEGQTLMHSSGKYIIASISTNTLYVYIYSSTGISLSNKTLNPTNVGTLKVCLVGEIDSDEVGVFVTGAYDSSHCRAVVYRLNVYTYVGTEEPSGNYGQGTSYNPNWHGGAVFYYNDDVYFCYNYYQITNPVTRLYCCRYDPDTDTLTNTGTVVTTTSSVGWLMGFQYDDTTCYVMTAYASSTTPNYFELDLTTRAYTLLASHPTGSVINTYRQVRFINGSVYYDDIGSQYWVYFTWVYSDSTPSVFIRQHRLVFNDTGIASANLDAQNERSLSIGLKSGIGSVYACVYGGYMEDKDAFHVYFANLDGNSVRTVNHYELSIPDWLDYTAISTITVEDSDYDATLPIFAKDEVSYRDFSITFQYIADGTTGYVIYDLDVLDATWTLTISWSPSATPRATQTMYSVTLTTYMNGVLKPSIIRFSVEGVQQWTRTTDTNGILIFEAYEGTSGYKSYTFSIYYSEVLVLNETHSYVFVGEYDPEDIPTGDVFPVALNQIMSVLPMLVIILLPAMMLFFTTDNPIMFAVGLAMGTGISVISGIAPTYMLFFMGLLIALIFVHELRGNNSNGG